MINPEFCKIATYQYPSEAMIFKGKLESEGIEVFLRDEMTINTDPMVSNAVGGVKLFVYKEDKEKAEAILQSISKYSVDDSGNAIQCPNCGSTKVDYLTTIKDFKSLLSFLFSILFVLLPFYTKHKYKCEACDFEFDKP